MSNPSHEPSRPYLRLSQPPPASSPLSWALPVAIALMLAGGLAFALGQRRGPSDTVAATAVPGADRPAGDAPPDRSGGRAQLQRDMAEARARSADPARQPTVRTTTQPDSAVSSRAPAEPTGRERVRAQVRTVRFGFESGPGGLGQAERYARERQRPLLLYFHTDWCRYCRQFEQEFLPDPAVIEVLGEQYVGAKLNPEASSSEAAAAERYGVRAYPTLLVVRGGRAERVTALPQGGPAALAAQLAQAAR